MNYIFLLVPLLLLMGCGPSNETEVTYEYKNESSSSSSRGDTPPYEMMEVAFEGYPNKKDIQPIMEAVMVRYDLDVTDRNLLKFASMLVSLRKDSKVGVTEMEILKHMYQNGGKDVSLPDQGGISATILESIK